MQFAATNIATWHGCRNMMDRRHQASRCRTALSSRSAASRHQAFDAPAAADGLRERGSDLTVLEVEDYIARPKPNGYRSLHALVEVPVHLSDRVVPVTVELQIRTVAMDFWASLEHKIYYKYRADVPPTLLRELAEAAETAASLDAQMERLHKQTHPAAPPAAVTGSALPS